jgi:hypothetical protein
MGQLPPGTALCAVGWLGDFVPSTGPTPLGCIDRLWDAYSRRLVFSDETMGWHNCEMCTTEAQHYPGGRIGPIIQWREQQLQLCGYGHHLVRFCNAVYMCPVLILHYILEHGYRPPDEFVRAVAEGCFLTPDDLVVIEETAGKSR